MPRYTYECTKCGHAYEKLEGWDAKPRQRCPQCRGASQRIPTAPAIVFKGSGFYATDNRHSSFAEKDGEGSGDGKSDGKGKPDGEGKSSVAGDGAAKNGGDGSTAKETSKTSEG